MKLLPISILSAMRVVLFALLALTWSTWEANADAFTPEQIEFFESRIRPILANECYDCHSSGAKKLKGDLHLDTRAGMLKGGESGAAIVPGKPDESLMIKAVRYKDEDTAMPPKKRLPQAQVADLKPGCAWAVRGRRRTERGWQRR